MLAFAAWWDRWECGDQVIESCVIVVGEVLPELTHLHNRVPLLIPLERQNAWLDPKLADSDQVRELLAPPSEGTLT